MKTCYQCGTPLDDATVFCTNCGAPMGNQPQAQVQTQPQPAMQPQPAPQPVAQPIQEPAQPITPASSLLEQPAPVEAPAQPTAPQVSVPVAPASKDTKTLLLIVGMAVCALIGITGLIFGIMSSGKKSSSPETPKTGTTVQAEAPVAGTKVAFGGIWQATIPDDMAFETEDGELVIGDTTGSKWVAYIDYDSSVPFSAISANFSTFGDYLTTHGYHDVKTGNDTFGDIEFYWADITDTTGITATVAFAAAPDLYSFQISSAVASGEADHSVLENVATVLGSVEKVTKSLRSGVDGTDPLTVPTIDYKWPQQ